MSMTKVDLESTPPDVPAAFRPRLRLGFGLCCATLALAIVVSLGVQLVPAVSGTVGSDALRDESASVKWGITVTDFVLEAVLVFSWVCLYTAPIGLRWRSTSAVLLAMGGADLVMMIMKIAGTDPFAHAVAERLGMALGWVELWMIAVLAADTAEATERSDITHQTEVTGQFILWGGAAWLAAEVWQFNPDQWLQSSANATPDSFAFVLVTAYAFLQIISLARTAIFCGQLAAALSPDAELPPPDGTI